MASSKKFGSSAQESTANLKDMEAERQPRYRPVNVNLFIILLNNNLKAEMHQVGMGGTGADVTQPNNLKAKCLRSSQV